MYEPRTSGPRFTENRLLDDEHTIASTLRFGRCASHGFVTATDQGGMSARETRVSRLRGFGPLPPKSGKQVADDRRWKCGPAAELVDDLQRIGVRRRVSNGGSRGDDAQ